MKPKMELAEAGRLNVFWFIASQLTVIFSIIETAGFWPTVYLPSVIKNFWTYLIVIFVCMNVVLKALYAGFIYATTVRSCLLGNVFGIGIYIAVHMERWRMVGWYFCVLSGFHFSEFLAIAWCNVESLSVSSFILNHSTGYWVALATSWVEFVAEIYFFPVMKTVKIVSWIGLAMCIAGECLRKTAMITASTNFNHLVQMEKEENHKLITHGVYSWCRHPSYLGWFIWSIGTQLLVMNPFCTVAYAYVSWYYFKERIMMEECYLLGFFQEDYADYQQRVGTGLPFIEGLVITKPQKML